MKFVQDISFHFNFPRLFKKLFKCNLLKNSNFVKKIIININLLKVANAKGKVNKNEKRLKRDKQKKTKLARLGLALKRWQKIFKHVLLQENLIISENVLIVPSLN